MKGLLDSLATVEMLVFCALLLSFALVKGLFNID